MYGLNEARRQGLLAQQIALVYQMRWYAGLTPAYPYPFEPWPRVPGDIYGYPLYQSVPQPIGHESRQVAPNRWIYRPIYPGQQPGAAMTAPDANAGGVAPNAGPELNAPNAAGPNPAVPNRAAPQPKRRPAAELPAPSDAQPGDFVPPTRTNLRTNGRQRAF